ncbi:unnamed protein product (macronuclear) [Paramecium tetraurelia]|uniref:Transmembrane protein n=1 Tax=Paramecium tetraurelia TaxID=5888 RepID=A0D1B1_PARTE|nr:uncharacterized protein GSPATT00012352001 [Paramecium tetraurelia]CAK76828.1 unnamed protein product [Paramecium tetraurelia]|eukprot:XP_001444225.1 hypothetical protein (macronuclear) [Paramecium tetraurelia strain d4-2]
MELNTDPIILQNSSTVSLGQFKPKYSQVIYSGSQVAASKEQQLNQGNENDSNKQKQAPLIEKEIEFRKIFSKFAVTNAIFGIYYLLTLILRGILLLESDDVVGIILLLTSYTLWGIAFCIAIKTFKDQRPSQLIIYQTNLFVIGIIDSYVQSFIFSALQGERVFYEFFFMSLWITTIVLLITLYCYCKTSKDLMIVIQYLKLEYLQHSSDTNV